MKKNEIPIFIATTGHRDLLSPELVEQDLHIFFSELQAAMPNSTFVLMSGLAAGADQLFVECGKTVLKEKAEIFAVLPFERNEYRKDFADDSLIKYDQFLAEAFQVVELPGSRENEADAYFAEGKYLVENANIMLALWDGNVPHTVLGEKICGGTADVVDYWLNYERNFPEKLFLSRRISDIITIHTERVENKDRISKKYEIDRACLGSILVWQQDDKSKFLSRFFGNRNTDYAFAQIDNYNAMCQRQDADRETSKQYLGITDTSYVENDIERFGVLDASANQVQKKYIRQFNIIFILSFILGVCAQIYGGIEHSFMTFSVFDIEICPVTLTLPLYFLFFIMVFVYTFFQQRSGCDNKYLDYRALAEALRINIFWKIAKVKQNVKDIFILKNGSCTEWISIALNNWALLDNNSDETIENKTDVLTAWVKDQQKYYIKNHQRLQKKIKKIVTIAKVFFITSFVIAVIFLTDTFIVQIIPQSLRYVAYACNGISVGGGSFIMAMLMFFIEKKGIEVVAGNYKQSGILFSHIINYSENADEQTRRNYLAFLGEEALKEHEQWLFNSRQRKPEPNI